MNRRYVVLVALLLTAACGSRVDSAQRAAATGPAGVTSAGASAANGGAAGAASGAAGAGSATATGPAAAAVAGGAATGPATTLAPPGGNGGATDVGVTADAIRLGNVTTLSGPVPGLFAGAVIGTQAFVAYQNSLGGVYGRKLTLDVRDDQFDTGQNRAQTIDAIGKAFGMVGSFSLYDDAAADQMQKLGVPDIQVPITDGLQKSPINFSVAPVRRGAPSGPWNFFKARFPQAIKVGALYGDIPAAKDNYLSQKNAAESVGYQFVYERGYQATETDFTADVIRMKSAGVQFVYDAGDVKAIARLASNMAQQGFKPAVYLTGTAYDAGYVQLAGAGAEGTLNMTTQAMYQGEDAPSIPEVGLFDQWLQKVKPGYKPDLFAAYGWGSARLFVKALQDAGPRPTRAGVLAVLRKIDSWTGNGMFPDAGPASKRQAVCFIVVRVHNGRFERYDSPAPGFLCQDSTFVVRK